MIQSGRRKEGLGGLFFNLRIAREVEERPNKNREGENDGARPEHKLATAFPHAVENIPKRRHAVIRHFEDERLGFDF